MNAIRNTQPAAPPRLYLVDGRPAVVCGRCYGTGYVQVGRPVRATDINPPDDLPCPAACEDGKLPATGAQAVALLLGDVLSRLPRGESAALDAIGNRVRAAHEVAENMNCNCSGDAPEAWEE